MVLIGRAANGAPIYISQSNAYSSSWQNASGGQSVTYVAGSGDLDDCNGTTVTTTEFPGGVYAYLIPASFPYFSSCLYQTND